MVRTEDLGEVDVRRGGEREMEAAILPAAPGFPGRRQVAMSRQEIVPADQPVVAGVDINRQLVALDDMANIGVGAGLPPVSDGVRVRRRPLLPVRETFRRLLRARGKRYDSNTYSRHGERILNC